MLRRNWNCSSSSSSTYTYTEWENAIALLYPLCLPIIICIAIKTRIHWNNTHLNTHIHSHNEYTKPAFIHNRKPTCIQRRLNFIWSDWALTFYHLIHSWRFTCMHQLHMDDLSFEEHKHDADKTKQLQQQHHTGTYTT